MYSAVPVLHATMAGSIPNFESVPETSALSVATPLSASRTYAKCSGFTSGSSTTSGSKERTASPSALRTSFRTCGLSTLPVATAP